MNYFYVGIGGFLGAIFRVETGKLLSELYPNHIFPYPTLIINLIGSFLLAYFLTVIRERFSLSPQLILLFSTGFLGSFTTFSTFSVETLRLVQLGAFDQAILYLLSSFILGIFFAWIGVKIALKTTTHDIRANIRRSES
ncbi:hypothetical protein BHF71_09685 [Vulcanibacillus modesticaldus]|uniref:Fluoride-specific ion channel FluC n=1 Tax=Vulcanibacillus modesticaldus TaxID=337097 RepID=A0A1D2YU25_9BACI|nr:fluoride efflux transporter CrcB [Vulcanibacillus modesticaldus]OEF99210.1 hypothetical protein BHF71_09685 [Vulcanibacillus modesticaldus]